MPVFWALFSAVPAATGKNRPGSVPPRILWRRFILRPAEDQLVPRQRQIFPSPEKQFFLLSFLLCFLMTYRPFNLDV